MRNYLALLGWGPTDDVEVRPIEEFVAMFRLEDVSPAPAFFDVKKLAHINAQYIRMLPTGDFVRRAAEFLPPEPGAPAALEELAPLVQQRVRTLAEVPDMVAFLWQDRPELDEPAWQKATRDPRSAEMLRLTADALERSEWTPEAVEEAVRGAATPAGYVGEGGNVQLSKAQAPIRVALTGRSVGPPLWESIVALGRERTLDRLVSAQGRLTS